MMVNEMNSKNSPSSTNMNNKGNLNNKNRANNNNNAAAKASAAAAAELNLANLTNELFGGGNAQQQALIASMLLQSQSASPANLLGNINLNDPLIASLVTTLLQQQQQPPEQAQSSAQANGGNHSWSKMLGEAAVSSKPSPKPNPNEQRGRPPTNDAAARRPAQSPQTNPGATQRPMQRTPQQSPQQERRPNQPMRPPQQQQQQHQQGDVQRKPQPPQHHQQQHQNRPQQQMQRPNNNQNNNNNANQARPKMNPPPPPNRPQNQQQQQQANNKQSLNQQHHNNNNNNNNNAKPQGNMKPPPNKSVNHQQQQQRQEASSSPGNNFSINDLLNSKNSNNNSAPNLNDPAQAAAYFADLLQSTNNFMLPNTSNNQFSNAAANLFGSGDPLMSMISAMASANGAANNNSKQANNQADPSAAVVAAYTSLLSQSMLPPSLGLGQSGASNPLEWLLQFPGLLPQQPASPSLPSPSAKSQGQQNNANRGQQQQQRPSNNAAANNNNNNNHMPRKQPVGQQQQQQPNQRNNVQQQNNNNRQHSQPPNQQRPNQQQQMNRSSSGNPQQRNAPPQNMQQQRNGANMRPGPEGNLIELVESKIKLPLKFGWRRETIVKEIHKNGIRGDVIYYSPCSKKLRTFQEIERYLNKNAKEMQQKGIRLTRENFTFSSKLIVGTFLKLKDQFNSLAGSNIFQPLNDGGAGGEQSADEELDDKIKRELKFDILSEDEIVAKICELNPTFKRRTHAYSSQTETDGESSSSSSAPRPSPSAANRPGMARPQGHQAAQQAKPAPRPAATANYDYHEEDDDDMPLNLSAMRGGKAGPAANAKTPGGKGGDLNLNEKIESLKRLKEEQERHFRNQQVQMQVQQLLQQQQHEMELLKLFETNSSQIQLQLELKQQQMNERQREQQRLRNEMIEAKRREKIVLRERKTREKWFEYIMTREHQFSATSSAPSVIQQVVISDDGTPQQTSVQQALLPFESIDDMQEKYTKPMPELKPLHVELPNGDGGGAIKETESDADASVLSLDWMGDALQTIEFVNTFHERLVEAIGEAAAEAGTAASSGGGPGLSALLSELLGNNGGAGVFDSIASLSVLENIESFRCGLENKTDKQRREISLVVQLLLRAAIINTSQSSADDEEEEEESEEEDEEEDEDDEEDEDEGEEQEEEEEDEAAAEEDQHEAPEEDEEKKDAAGLKDTSKSESTNGVVDSPAKKPAPPVVDPAAEALKHKEQDDVYQIGKLNELECNDVTYSELLRLYLKRSLNSLKKRRSLYKFNVDVTGGLFDRLTLFVAHLERHAFEMLPPGLKAGMMAFLCDELLNNYNQNWLAEDAAADADDYKGLVTSDLDQAIEELNEIKHEKWQVESKIRALKMEKLNATVAMNSAVQATIAKFNELNPPIVVPAEKAPAPAAEAPEGAAKKEGEAETAAKEPAEPTADAEIEKLKEAAAEREREREKEVEKERDKHQKGIQQLEKKIAQLEKKKLQLKKSYEESMNKLRSGAHLGQDRFYRHYWQLNNLGGIYVEATHEAGPESMYCSGADKPPESPVPAVVAAEKQEDVEMKEEPASLVKEEVKEEASNGEKASGEEKIETDAEAKEEPKEEAMAVDEQEEEDKKASENVSVFSLKEEIKREQESLRQRVAAEEEEEEKTKEKAEDEEKKAAAEAAEKEKLPNGTVVAEKPSEKDPDAEVIEKYGHLIERHSTDDVFKFTLKVNEPEALELTFRQIEILVRNQIEHKQPQPIDAKFLNGRSADAKWWICDTELLFKQLQDCMCKRGYRERFLSKALSKLNEENYNNSQSTASIANTIAATSAPSATNASAAETGTGAAAPGAAPTVYGRFANNLGNLQMFEKLNNLLKDLIQAQKQEQEKLAKVQEEKTEKEPEKESEEKPVETAEAEVKKEQAEEETKPEKKPEVADEPTEKKEKEEESCDGESQKAQLEKLFLEKNAALENKDQTKLLKQIYALEDRVFNANLQQIPSLNSSLASQHLNTSNRGGGGGDNDDEAGKPPLEVAITHLLNLEKRIERRYLKPPFAPRKRLNTAKITSYLKALKAAKDGEVKADEDAKSSSSPGKGAAAGVVLSSSSLMVTRELERWRRLVKSAQTCSQLALLVIELNKCIAWDKSIMKVNCQICNSDDNEDQLLLCDNCDCGNHTYCFKPPLEEIPEGDWYCYVCIGKYSKSGERLCCVCGSSASFSPHFSLAEQQAHQQQHYPITSKNSGNKLNDLQKCDKCGKVFHYQCMPNARCFKTSSKWTCVSCQTTKGKAKQNQANSESNKRDEEAKKGGKKQLAAAKLLAAKNNKAVGGKKRKLAEDSNADSSASSTEMSAEPAASKAKKLKKVPQKPGRKPKAGPAPKNGKAGKKTATAAAGRKRKNEDVSQNEDEETEEAADEEESDSDESQDEEAAVDEDEQEEQESGDEVENEDGEDGENEDEDEEESADEDDEDDDEEEDKSDAKASKTNGHKPKGRPRKQAAAKDPPSASEQSPPSKKRGRKGPAATKPKAKKSAAAPASNAKSGAKTAGKKNAKSNASDSNVDSQDNQSSAAASPAASATHPGRDREMSLCRMLLNDLVKNENSWPFMEQVDEKSYPDYYEVIKEPMDITTIKNKLKAKQYESKEQFAYDCRLIFDNCEYFNEDHSKIGKAGHNLRHFFETKWMKIFD